MVERCTGSGVSSSELLGLELWRDLLTSVRQWLRLVSKHRRLLASCFLVNRDKCWGSSSGLIELISVKQLLTRSYPYPRKMTRGIQEPARQSGLQRPSCLQRPSGPRSTCGLRRPSDLRRPQISRCHQTFGCHQASRCHPASESHQTSKAR